jgi:hypothetical protein
MFQDLDSTIEAILNDGNAPANLSGADVSFEAPTKTYVSRAATVNLFLYEVKENRELRDPVPITDVVGGAFVQRKPPLRVDCAYLVTTWADPNSNTKVRDEHQLLGQALHWLSHFPTIPTVYFQGSLNNPQQPFPPPTMVAQMDGLRDAGEFWSALGIPPRPYFSLIVTIAMDLGQSEQIGPPVVAKEIRIKRKMPPGVAVPLLDDTFEIAGTVRSVTSGALSDVQVTLLPLGRTSTTDADGHFRFLDLTAGNYTLKTTKPNFAAPDKPIVIPPVQGGGANQYDVNMTP